jgi:hypothetical protein
MVSSPNSLAFWGGFVAASCTVLVPVYCKTFFFFGVVGFT